MIAISVCIFFFSICKVFIKIDLCLLHEMVYNKRSQWRIGTFLLAFPPGSVSGFL